MQHLHDLGGKVGTVLASIGSFIAAQVLSETILNELVRLLSSSLIAALGAAIGYYITRLLRRLEERRRDRNDPPDFPNPGAVADARFKNQEPRQADAKDSSTV